MTEQDPEDPELADDAGDAGLERALELRRAVVGPEYVERARSHHDAFRAVDDWVCEVAWGKVWNRPGLDLATRSIITVSVLAALGRETELGLHVQAARRNGVTDEQLAEVLLHVAMYAGGPAAVAGMRVARRALADES